MGGRPPRTTAAMASHARLSIALRANSHSRWDPGMTVRISTSTAPTAPPTEHPTSRPATICPQALAEPANVLIKRIHLSEARLALTGLDQ